MLIVYFSNVSSFTERFVSKLDVRSKRIPIYSKEKFLQVDEPYILIVPTYAGGRDGQGAVPKQVIKFLNDDTNRSHLKAVIGTGNTNFGSEYCAAAYIISHKTKVPIVDLVEMFGTPEEVDRVKNKIREIGRSH